VKGQARENQQRIGLYYALYMAKRLLDSEVPPGILEELKPGWFRERLTSQFLDPALILRARRTRGIMVYWDIVRLITVDRVEDILEAPIFLFFAHYDKLVSRHGLAYKSKTKILGRVAEDLRLFWLIITALLARRTYLGVGKERRSSPSK